MNRSLRHRGRSVVLWFVFGLLASQPVLTLTVEFFQPGIRDPHWAALLADLRQRRKDMPGRDLVVILGSSRSLAGLDADRLSRPDGPIVVNASVPGGGALMQRIFLERLLTDRIRPRRIVLEIMPLFYTTPGAEQEDGFLVAQRLSFGELRATAREVARPRALVTAWLSARLTPLTTHHSAWREQVLPGEQFPSEEPPRTGSQSARVSMNVHQYRQALDSKELNARRSRAFRQLLDRCQEEGIEVTLFVGPEHSRFRAATGAALAEQIENLLAIASEEYGLAVHDARDWLSDDLFEDGHHAGREGARRLSERFASEVLAVADPPGANLRAVSEGRGCYNSASERQRPSPDRD
jgi:hypothetical protein